MDRHEHWLRKNRRGNYSILMGVSIFAIMGFSALAVDISLITMSELQVSALADAASHAALVSYLKDEDRTQGLAAAEFLSEFNKVGMGKADLAQIRFGQYDYGTRLFCDNCSPTGNVNAVEVTMSRTGDNAVNLLLAPMFGVHTHDVDSRSVSASQQRALVLVNDASCSMMSGGAIDTLRSASQLVLRHMVDLPQEGDMLGMAIYAAHAARAEESGGGATLDAREPPWAVLSKIDGNLPYLSDRFDRLCSTIRGCSHGPEDGPRYQQIGGCTNPAIAMGQAVEQIRTLTDTTYFRAMVVMSDGVFNCIGFNAYNEGQAEANALDIANTAFEKFDIAIWSILWHNGSFDTQPMQDITKGIGFAQVSPSADELPQMYAAMLDSLPKAIVD